PFVLPGVTPSSHHYPSGPYQAYILSNGYHFARRGVDDGTEDEPNGIGPGRLYGLLRVFEHGPGEDPEFLGEGVRVALRVGAVPYGRIPLVPDAWRWARRNPTGAGEGDPGEHQLRSRRSTDRSRTWKHWESCIISSRASSRRRRSSTATTSVSCTTW